MSLRSCRVLVVDDDAGERADMRHLLLCGSDTHYLFAEADRGATAVQMIGTADAAAFDCVLHDFFLPDMDALEVLVALHDGTGGMPCPIIVLTGSDRKLGTQVVQAGAQDYLGKNDLTPLSLTRAVENAIDRFALLAERERTERALRASEERYRTLFESIDEGFCVIRMLHDEPDRAVDFRYLEVNPGFETITGLAPTALQRDSLDQILKAGWYLLQLINEILDLALIESGQPAMTPETMSLTAVLRECEAMIAPLARKTGIRLEFATTRSPMLLVADRRRIKQVFINLLSNAIRYNRPGGMVRVTRSDDGAARLRVSVEDTGDGLSPDQVAHLFEPFQRLGQEAGLKEGTGIGLVVSKRLVELMGGAIGAESRVGQGSVFWVEFDAAPSRPPGEHAASPPGPAGVAPAALPCTAIAIENHLAALTMGRAQPLPESNQEKP